MPNGSLGQLLERRDLVLTEDDIRGIMVDIVEGLYYLHTNQVVHRDLKPDNLLLTADNHIKISDFGVSQILQAQSVTQSAAVPCPGTPRSSDQRRSRRFSGTPAFASPEQIADPHGDWDRRGVDIWALGVILFRLMHGRMPSKAKSVFETYTTIADPAAPDPVERPAVAVAAAAVGPMESRPSFSEPLWDLLRHLMDRDHTRRFTIGQVLAHEWIQQSVSGLNDVRHRPRVSSSSTVTTSCENSTES